MRKVHNGDIHPEDRALYLQRRATYSRDVVGPWLGRNAVLYADLYEALSGALREPQGVLDLDLPYVQGLGATPHVGALTGPSS